MPSARLSERERGHAARPTFHGELSEQAPAGIKHTARGYVGKDIAPNNNTGRAGGINFGQARPTRSMAMRYGSSKDRADTPIRVVGAGGSDACNQSAATPYVYQGKLYYGSQIFMGIKFKGCDLIRIDENDHSDTIVGQNGRSG